VIGTLERWLQCPFGVLGELTLGEFSCWTLERPWEGNKPFVSCVPEGVYAIAPDQEGRYTGYPELQAVPERTEIIIHPANTIGEIEGCIAPAFGYVLSNSSLRLTGTSQAAYDQLIAAAGEHWTLVIRSRRSRL